MATLSSLHCALSILLLALIPFNATSSSHHDHLKSLHFSLLQHETMNKTGYIIVNGVEGKPGITETTTNFGTLFVFEDPLTTTANRSSKLVGIAEGTTITSSLDGLRSISIGKVTLRLNHHKGSISIVGGTHNTRPSDHPIIGGTGDFLLARGYITIPLSILRVQPSSTRLNFVFIGLHMQLEYLKSLENHQNRRS